jgi:hypothetical protein
VERLIVVWPDGARSIVAPVAMGEQLTVTRHSAPE